MSSLPLGVVHERRRRRRYPVDVACQAVTDYDFFLLGEQIADLSEEGLLLRSDGTPAELGERVLVSFRPPGSVQWIDAEATVVRLVTGTQPGAPGVGLQLHDLAPFEQGLLAASLELSRRERSGPRPIVSVRRRAFPGEVAARAVVAIRPTHPPTVNGIAQVVVLR
ncbi:MAG: PilZ domain-containing protein [Sandaracinaceae bacterium]|nr:PilZ domain-containing protein [Sandaracinaceae bacterium]